MTDVFLPFQRAEIEQSISNRFEGQAKLYPDRIAIASAGKSISYSALNRSANQIAWAVLGFFGEPQTRVALLLESGDLIVAAILGVLKSGNIYVPIDPAGPKSRNQFILRHAQVRLVLTNERYSSLARDLADKEVQVISLDQLESLSVENPNQSVSPNAIAYIIYTSGSTGHPKGVLETHRNLLHNVMRNTNTLRICAEDRISLLRSIAAGGAARDALSALLNGAALCPFSVKDSGLGTLVHWLVQQEISIFTTVITVFRHLVATFSGQEQFPALRMIYAGGEQVTTRDVELYKKYFPDHCVFVNRLGITETGTVAYFFIDKKTPLPDGAVPVGYPAEDTSFLLLDENGSEVGVGAIGEIAVRSEYVAPGYWRNPEASEAVFLPDPEGGKRRIYLTGDFGQRLSDGCLVHLGWKDFQVNIRGYRIELSEVEAELLNHPDVSEAAVVGREHPSGEIRLAAAVVFAGKNAVSSESLRSFLERRLPDHMIPSAFVFLDALPVNANGKIDRRALPMPDWLPDTNSKKIVRPRTEVEEVIIDIWRATLGLEAIGIHDDFFDLGGHSLLLGQVISKLQAAFQVDLPLDNVLKEPTVAVLAEMVQGARGLAPITPVSRSHPLPLSFAQERLWFLHQLEPDNLSYNFPTATIIEGELNVEALQRALNEVVRRHETLRTAFALLNDQPVQMIIQELSLALRVTELSGVTESRRETEALALVSKLVQERFDISKAPLLRTALIRFDDYRHVFVTVHHLIADAWSMGILFNELALLYEQFSTGRPANLPELPIQYADFAAWQRRSFDGSSWEPAITYWKKHLEDLSLVDLPSDHPRPAGQSFRGAKQTVALPKYLTTAIKNLSEARAVTVFMILLAALKALIHRYIDAEDIVVGSPVAGRNRAEIENVVGLFTNTLVLRTRFDRNQSFLELLNRVRETCLQAYTHGSLPFEKLVEELHPNRDLSRNPLFQVMFILQNTPNSVLNISGLATRRLEVDSGGSKFDLTVSLYEDKGALIGSFEYSTDLFERFTIQRMMRQYVTLLEGVVARPDLPISDVAILTAEERDQLLVEWNHTKTDYPKDKSLHELFEKQAELTPDAIAVIFEGQQLNYQQLNARANQFASYLIALGVGRETLVGVCVERSVDMVVGLLGILKAGGAYVPLDPSFPRGRLASMVEDAKVYAVVTHAKLLETLRLSAVNVRPTYVCLDSDWPVIESAAAENPLSRTTPEALAYVIYTSGSSGQPKGVQVSHRSIVNCLHSIGQRLGFTNKDVLLAVTTISFDIAVLELFLPLFFGGTVALASRDDVVDGTELLRRLTESSATFMQATPSTWRLLLEAGWRGSQGFKILCGGESMSRELAEALLPCGDVWNLYGPTETTIWSTVHNVQSGQEPVPIGRPIGNTQVFILDSYLRPVPVGVHGELCIGGAGLARGYLNQPELTAEKFIANPFAPGERLYRTGDRARYRADGNVEFLGRLDHQVKIRGYRIELGEIEEALTQHPGVRQAVVLAREQESVERGDAANPKTKIENPKLLTAYVVPKQEPPPSIAELRGYLNEKIPEYMVPSMFILLDGLPLTANGKIDQNALPPPDGIRPDLKDEPVAPRTDIEELVAQVWREVLRVDLVGVHDNFFDLGGHSLLATRVIARLRANFAIDLPLRKLFELPTVAALTHYIDTLLQDQRGARTPPILPVPRDRPVPASFSQQRLWFLREVDPNSTAYNISFVFSVRGPLDVAAFEEALNGIIARHEILRTTFDLVGGVLVQNIQSFRTLNVAISEIAALKPDARHARAREIALEEAHRPFDLRNGPLLRAKIVKAGEGHHWLLLNFDHTVLDGSSMGVLFRELGSLYEALTNGEAKPLLPLPIQYADYAVWQRDALKSEALALQLEYWKRQLAELTPLSIPADYPRAVIQTFRGVRKALYLSKQLTDSLKELSRREGVTLFMTLLAGFQLLLSRCSGQGDVVVGSTIAGRSRAEMEGLIGFFINALPLRTDLSGNPTFLELSKRVREVCLGAYAHQDLPFEKMVEAINPTRDLSRNPLFQVMFNMADVSERELRLAGCEVRQEAFFDPEAKFDITLYAPEKDGAIELAMVYNADLFSESRISIMLEQFRYLLSQIIDNPLVGIGEYSLVLPSTRALLPDPTEPLDATWEGSIHSYVTEWAERAPGQVAVVGSDAVWTYAEIETCSNRLAISLIAHGIHPKDVVAIYAHRSSCLVPALLGVLKAGAAFVIVDPAYPPARLIAYLQIARPKGWIQIAAAGELPQELAAYLETLNLGCRLHLPSGKQALVDFLSQHPDIIIEVIAGANDPAYIAFTSGSTGKPKGVLSRHGPITHFLPRQKEAFDLRETDRFCLLSGLAYNHLHRDIFTALYLGATLYVPPPEIVREPESLTEWLRANGISVLHLTPALGQLLLTAAAQPLPAMRRVFFGGDVLTRGDVARIRELAPNATIGCFYGATETQRAVGYYEIPQDFAVAGTEANRPVPLGKGIKDVQLLLLNKSGQLAGVGELAELYVRSPHLAEGYIGDEARTKEVFISNLFTNDPNDRVYRTGELGRYLPDANVECTGRNDRCVNIRGFRVELEEIEFVLNQHPAVNAAAVVLQDFGMSSSENPKPETRNPKSGQRLVAYVAADESCDSMGDLLRSFISTRLPDYMVPAHFVTLEQLPLSPNGKIDYRALLHVTPLQSLSSSPTAAPRNELETKLVAIFCQVLGREQVGIEENFFRLGGHSLLAAQAAARIREAFGIGLELRTFLESPTIAALAKEIEVRLKAADATLGTDKTDREEIEL